MAAAMAQDRLRQIAILVSSVDATAARHILLRLPSDIARQVRAMTSQMGTISPEEKRQILGEFQRSAATAAKRESVAVATPVAQVALQQSSRAEGEQLGHSVAGGSHQETLPANGTASEKAPAAWTRLSTAALVGFVRDESPAITAVVISQLPPPVAVEVLQSLAADVSREVMLRLSRLQEIAPEAMAEIDEHLSQRLSEYEHRLESELENSRRIDALLQAAPDSLRRQWASDLGVAHQHAEPTPPLEPAAELLNSLEQAAPDTLELTAEGLELEANREQSSAGVGEPSLSEADATILPFARNPDRQYQQVDRSLIEIEFEQILALPPATLAALLSSTDSQTVLLALAGATPEFMRRFYRMLDRGDAKILQSRLQRIGAIKMRDVDEAQRCIVENAARLGGNPLNAERKVA